MKLEKTAGRIACGEQLFALIRRVGSNPDQFHYVAESLTEEDADKILLALKQREELLELLEQVIFVTRGLEPQVAMMIKIEAMRSLDI